LRLSAWKDCEHDEVSREGTHGDAGCPGQQSLASAPNTVSANRREKPDGQQEWKRSRPFGRLARRQEVIDALAVGRPLGAILGTSVLGLASQMIDRAPEHDDRTTPKEDEGPPPAGEFNAAAVHDAFIGQTATKVNMNRSWRGSGCGRLGRRSGLSPEAAQESQVIP
jgi:hypothetical protein